MISEVAKPFAFFLIIVGITSAFGGNAGAAINPVCIAHHIFNIIGIFSFYFIVQARDLGPRLFAAFIYGWKKVFQANDYFFWVPIIGPIIGAIIGVWLFEGYSSLVKRFLNLPKPDFVELTPKVKSLDDDDQAMISQELTTIRS